MPHFRKKPVDVRAVLWTGANAGEVDQFLADGMEFSTFGMVNGRYVDICAKGGLKVASPGDWIVRNGPADFFPMKPDIFAATYEPVET